MERSARDHAVSEAQRSGPPGTSLRDAGVLLASISVFARFAGDDHLWSLCLGLLGCWLIGLFWLSTVLHRRDSA